MVPLPFSSAAWMALSSVAKGVSWERPSLLVSFPVGLTYQGPPLGRVAVSAKDTKGDQECEGRYESAEMSNVHEKPLLSGFVVNG